MSEYSYRDGRGPDEVSVLTDEELAYEQAEQFLGRKVRLERASHHYYRVYNDDGDFLGLAESWGGNDPSFRMIN